MTPDVELVKSKQKPYEGVTRIISGGQTGADKAGLVAAKILGIKTSGTCPYGCRTENGSDRSLTLEYGLIEHVSPDYPPRTRCNVEESDGTVIFGIPWSPGSKLTRELCIEMTKPYIFNPDKIGFLAWLAMNNVRVLNVAGNRESTQPGIFDRVVSFLLEALSEDEPDDDDEDMAGGE